VLVALSYNVALFHEDTEDNLHVLVAVNIVVNVT
jgi:hypothetical protein